MGYKMYVAIGYKDIFDDFELVSIKEFIEDIPTKNSLQILGYFMAQLHSREYEIHLQIEFLRMWMGRLPENVHIKINRFINSTNGKNAQYSFLDNTSLLKLVEHILVNHNDLSLADNLSEDQELKLFKAYLICSQEWIDKQRGNFEIKEVKNELDIIKVLLPSQIPYQEINELKDFRIQFIKTIYFFKFCKSNKEFNNYLDIFLKEYKLKHWKDYVKNILTLYIRKFEELRTPSVINVPEEFADAISFLEDLSIDYKNFKIKLDFLNLREKPIYKIDEHNFLFLNLNFLVDKIYQGIQFDFAKVLVKHNATYKDKIIKTTADFMGIFGNEFSENGLFYSVMNFAFGKSKYKMLSGEELKTHVEAEPDFYIRDKGKIYLFEFKNIYLNSKTKHSYDLEVIKQEIFKKLVENQNGKPKGVSQLINTIELIRAGKFKEVDSFDCENVIIYPIIVYVDFSFNLPGVNFILNKEFMRLLENKGINFLKNVKNLTMIDLDTFIKFQDLFRDGRIKINHLLNGYFNVLQNPWDIFNRISTFNQHIHFETSKVNYNSPDMLMEEAGKIFPED